MADTDTPNEILHFTIITFAADHWIVVSEDIEQVAETLTPGEWGRFHCVDGETVIVREADVRCLKSMTVDPSKAQEVPAEAPAE